MNPAKAQGVAVKALPVPEKGFLQAVYDYARLQGWKAMHVYDARRCTPGWPDLFMVRGPRAVAAELKSTRGRMTAEQADWLLALTVAGIETYTWFPSDWDCEDGIEDVLGREL